MVYVFDEARRISNFELLLNSPSTIVSNKKRNKFLGRFYPNYMNLERMNSDVVLFTHSCFISFISETWEKVVCPFVDFFLKGRLYLAILSVIKGDHVMRSIYLLLYTQRVSFLWMSERINRAPNTAQPGPEGILSNCHKNDEIWFRDKRGEKNLRRGENVHWTQKSQLTI